MFGGASSVQAGSLIGIAAVWILAEQWQGRQRRSEATKTDSGSRIVVGISYAVGAISASLLRNHVGGLITPADTGRWVGLGVLACGVALRIWSFRTLGRYFTFTVQTSTDQPVVTAGPYRFVRHPGYLALILVFAGIGLAIGSWWSLATLVGCITAGLSWRIHIEERALVAAIGEPYAAYAASHKRLVPFIW
jgi:protein-S-isoprenylcysteine O-methyltransferase Ste14